MKKRGFTLAEVLITLGIIGIVAAMTLPSLLSKYQKKVTVNKLRKAYAEIAQAVQLSEAEYGMVDTWNYSSMQGNDNVEKGVALINEYLIKRLKITKICTPENLEKCIPNPLKTLQGSTGIGLTPRIYAITASGYGILFHVGGNNPNFSQHIHMLVDIDGPFNGVNIIGKDNFLITLNLGNQKSVEGVENRDKKSGLVMYGSGWKPPLTRDELKNYPDNTLLGCNKQARGSMCGALIEADGWEIKDDYPW